MSEAEQEIHLERLTLLSQGASDVKISADGFAFQIDLRVMSAADLEAWALNEQKCCSFLEITHHVVEEDRRATVDVVCPSEFKAEALHSFGLTVAA